jgi:hypothetical protein
MLNRVLIVFSIRYFSVAGLLMQEDNRSFLVCKKKMETSPEMLCEFCPDPFKRFVEMVTTMKFDEVLNYQKLVSLFEDMIEGPASRPIRIDGALEVYTALSTTCICTACIRFTHASVMQIIGWK